MITYYIFASTAIFLLGLSCNLDNLFFKFFGSQFGSFAASTCAHYFAIFLLWLYFIFSCMICLLQWLLICLEVIILPKYLFNGLQQHFFDNSPSILYVAYWMYVSNKKIHVHSLLL